MRKFYPSLVGKFFSGSKKYVLFILFVKSSLTLFAQPTINSFSPTSAGIGTAVTITGKNLSGVTAVSFGGTPANFFFNIDSVTIRAYVGQGSSGEVSVTTSKGTSSLAGFTFIPPPVINSINPSQGYAGTTITIKGSGFSYAYRVSFGNTIAASFNIVSDSVINATVGSGATGNVTVSGTNGTATLGGFVFIGPQIASFSPTSGADGTVVTITGNNFIGATAVSFGGIPAKSFSVVSSTAITAIVDSQPSGDVAVTSNYGTGKAPGFNKPYIISFDPTFGGPGSVVTIKGYNFTNSSEVRFGDSTAKSFSVISDTVIKATVGYGASGNVMVKALSDSAVKPFFFFSYPWPSITSFGPATGKFGTPITIKGQHFLGVKNVSFGGSNAQTFSVISDTVIIATPGTGAAGKIQITSGGGSIASIDGFKYIPMPVITAFTPTSGPAGTNVVITGGNFSGNPDSNHVFFGAVKAKVIQADTGKLVVEVPYGTGYQPITVATNGYITSSPGTFQSTFAGGLPSFSDSSFEARVDIPTVGTSPQYLAAGDFDGDGKTDVVVSDGLFGNKQSISVYKNVSEDSKIAFAAPLELFISTGTTYNSLPVLVADIDADGKPDLVFTNAAQYKVSILRNISTGGQIIFAEKKDFNVDAIVESYWMSPQNATVADFDGDGKLDLAFAYYSSIMSQGRISIMRNLSSGNQILFGAKQFYNVDHPWRIHTGDFNNDHKPDIAVAVDAKGSTDAKQVYILGNASEPGNISFKTSGLVGRSVFANSLALGDLDGDKKDDITVMNVETHTVSIFHNITTSFYTTFKPGIEYTLEYQTRYADINDIDGDGKPDLGVSNGVTSKVSLLKNRSDIGAISFDKKQEYITANGSNQVLLVDLDIDGRPDMVSANSSSATISIFRNRIGEPKIVPAGNNPVTGSINKKVRVDSAVINYNGNIFVQRHYDIEPKANPATSTARLTLYFTQQEFDNYNAYPAHGKDLPKHLTDTAGIANIRIYQYHGSSSAGTPGTYTGDAAEINPADSSIRWNADAECWELTFDVNGFSGFFLGTTLADGVPLPDLFITNQKLNPLSAETGETVTCNFTVANQGEGAAPAHKLYFYLSEDNILTPGANGDTLLDDSDISGINSNSDSGSLAQALKIPCSIAPGNYYLFIVADGANTVVEKNENNNLVSIPVTINARPDITLSTSATSICAGGTITLTASGATDYSWSGADLNSTTGNLVIASPATPGNYTYSVTGTSNGCSQTQSVVISVNTAPSVTIVQKDTSICEGSSITLSSSASAGNQWFRDNTLISGATSPTYIITQAGNYKVVVNDGTCSVASSSVAVAVNPVPPTPVVTAGGPASFCEGGNLLLTSSSTSGNQWYKDGITINGATGSSYTTTQSGNYSVKLTANGCTSALSGGITVTVNSIPATPVITQSGSILTSSSNSGNQWYKNGVAITGATAASYTPVETAEYSASVTLNGCTSAKSPAISYLVTAIDPVPGNSLGIRLYPNPTNGSFVIDTLKLSDNWENLEIFDTDGRKKLANFNIRNKTTVSIDINHLANGFYTAILRRRSGQPAVIKFIKL